MGIGSFLLHQHAKIGDLGSLKLQLEEADFLETGETLDSRDLSECNILHIAAHYGHPHIVEFALEDPSITIDARSVAGDTPLIVAAKNGHLKILKMLVENGAEVNLANDHGNTALHYTCFFRFKECTLYLIQRAGARIHVANKYDRKPLDRAGEEMKELVNELAPDAGETIMANARSFIDAQVENKIQFLAKTSQIVEIPIASISRNQLLMKTYRSEIRKGVFHAKPIICKKLARQNINPEEIKLLRDELKTIRPLVHKNLLMISAVCVVPPNVSIITEYESTGDLLYVLSNPDIDLDATLAIRIAEGICEGMLFLHSRNACHYNLKSRNVILTSDYVPKLTDFGFKDSVFAKMPKISSTVPPNLIPAGRSVLRTVIHDAAYIAPEIYIACQLIESGSSNIYVDFEQVDIFAFSIILYEIATRLPPFDDMNSMRIGYQILLSDIRPIFPEFVPDTLAILIEECWASNPADRPKFELILPTIRHFLSSIILHGPNEIIDYDAEFGGDTMEGEAGRSTRDASQQNLDGGERNGGANHSNNGSAEGGFNSQDTGALDYYETGEDGGDGDWRQGIYDGGDNDDGGGSNEEMNNAIVNPSGGRSTVKSDLHQKQQRVRAISSESIERVVDAGLGSGGDVSNRNAKATMSSNKQRKGKSLTKMLAAGSQGSIGGSMGSLSRKSVNSVGSEQLGSQESMVSAGSSSNVYRSWGDFPRTNPKPATQWTDDVDMTEELAKMGISSSALDGLKPSPNDSPHDARKATIISEKMAEAATLGNSTIRRIQKKASVSGEGAGVGSNSSVNLRKPSAVSSTIDETPRESTYSYESSNSRSNATTMKGKSPFNIVSSKKQQQHQQPSASAAADAQIQQQKKTAAALAELDELDRVLADALNDL